MSNYIKQASAFGTRECHTFRTAIFDRFPLIAEDLARVYVGIARKKRAGYRDANNWLRQIPERLLCGPWNVTHDDEALVDHAVAQARIVELARAKAYGEDMDMLHFAPHTGSLVTPVMETGVIALYLQRVANLARTAGMRKAIEVGERLCHKHGIEAPSGSLSLTSRLLRLMCSRWWRRRLRVLSGRRLEQLMREMGRVHKRAGIYASDLTIRRRRSQEARNNALLEAFVAINQHGEQFTLAELSELGIANPSHRYSEMMLRIRDTEAVALRMGHQGLFFTWTCPSKYHRVHAATAKMNHKYNGATPRDAHKYLADLWAKVRAKFSREQIRIYGLRVVEPHHDGTPHWHMMLWVEPEHQDYVTEVLRDYALREDGDEKGALEYRFKAEKIVPGKGGAVSYLAKYVGKGVGHTKDGDIDKYGFDMASAALRIVAWAATWGIRQFQFIGQPSVTIWRHLRKINERTQDQFKQWQLTFNYEPAHKEFTEKLINACDAGQWDQFIQLMGGPAIPRDERPAQTWVLDKEDFDRVDGIARGQYGEILKGIYGVTILGDEYLTLFNRWEVKHRREVGSITAGFKAAESGEGVEVKRATGSPWIHVNNCTRPYGQPVVDAFERVRIKVNNRWEELPAWRAAEKIDDYLLDTYHMKQISKPRVLSESEIQQQQASFREFITSPEYLAEQEHMHEVNQEWERYRNSDSWIPIPRENTRELREIL